MSSFLRFGHARDTILSPYHLGRSGLVSQFVFGPVYQFVLQTNIECISTAIDQAMPQLSMNDNYVARCIHGYTVPVDLNVGTDTRKIFVHVFRDEQRRPLDEAAPPDAPVCSASVSSSFS